MLKVRGEIRVPFDITLEGWTPEMFAKLDGPLQELMVRNAMSEQPGWGPHFHRKYFSFGVLPAEPTPPEIPSDLQIEIPAIDLAGSPFAPTEP